jgi:hypothetical protein
VLPPGPTILEQLVGPVVPFPERCFLDRGLAGSFPGFSKPGGAYKSFDRRSARFIGRQTFLNKNVYFTTIPSTLKLLESIWIRTKRPEIKSIAKYNTAAIVINNDVNVSTGKRSDS